LLDGVADATGEIGFALAALSEAYELLDEHAADTLERELFLPVRMAYGRAQRIHAEFAERSGLLSRAFEPASQAAPSRGVRGLLESTTEAVEEAGRRSGSASGPRRGSQVARRHSWPSA
jgi:hypothetical protein